MNTANTQNEQHLMYKTARASEPNFIKVGDDDAMEILRNKSCNTDIFVSVCFYEAPDILAPRVYPLYFYIQSDDADKTRISTLEACYYITDRLHISEDDIEIIYAGGKSNNHNSGGGENYNSTDVNCNDRTYKMHISIPPLVFDGQPTPFMPALNYHLARQLINDGVKNVDIDVYRRDYSIPLPNSIQDGNYVIPVTVKELLNLDISAIAKLSTQPRAEDSLILPQRISEAAEWFAETLAEFEKMLRRQQQLGKAMLEKGWQIPPCIRRLTWMDLSKEQALEACRIISQFYSWTKASSDEIWYHLQQINRRNHIEDYPRLKAIIAFALENPGFAGCQYLLLKQFCLAGKCFIKELIDEYEKPYLFNDI